MLTNNKSFKTNASNSLHSDAPLNQDLPVIVVTSDTPTATVEHQDDYDIETETTCSVTSIQSIPATLAPELPVRQPLKEQPTPELCAVSPIAFSESPQSNSSNNIPKFRNKKELDNYYEQLHLQDLDRQLAARLEEHEWRSLETRKVKKIYPQERQRVEAQGLIHHNRAKSDSALTNCLFSQSKLKHPAQPKRLYSLGTFKSKGFLDSKGSLKDKYKNVTSLKK